MTDQHHSTKDPRCRWAVFYLLSGLMESLAPLGVGLKLVPPRFWLAMAVYLTGLITQTNVTVTAIATTVGLVSHDGLSRLLAGLGWTLSHGACLAVRLVQALGGEGYLVLDDVLIPKPFARVIALCGWDYDHSLKRHVFGQRLVFVVWSNGSLVLPLLFAFWQKGPEPARLLPACRARGAGRQRGQARPRRRRRRRVGRPRKRGRPITDHSAQGRRRRALKRARLTAQKRRRVRLPNGVHYRTKNELARALVWTVVRHGLPAAPAAQAGLPTAAQAGLPTAAQAGLRGRFILFDNWYFSRQNIALFQRLELHWVTRVKGNAKVWLDGRCLTVQQVAALVTKANYHYYRALGVRWRSFEVYWEGRRLKLTVIKDDRGPEGGRTKYLLTDDRSLTNQQHVRWYRKRWVIEVFFRDAKQEVGLAGGEARTPPAVISHVVLVCVAYTFLQLLKPVAAARRPSVRASKDARAPLVMVVTLEGHRQVARPDSTGQFHVLSLDHLWHPVRTRLPGLPCHKKPVFP
jgi:hypothetical protein